MEYDLLKDWRFIKSTNEIPIDIIRFIDNTFQIIEIRERVGDIKGIKFEVRSSEKNHPVPHIHARYGEYWIEIAIESRSVLSGNLPKKQQKFAIDWVSDHSEELLNKWNSFTISATSIMTKSGLEQP